MSNLTVAVDEQLIKRARIRAIGEGTSVSALVREFLTQYVNTGSPASDGGLASGLAAEVTSGNDLASTRPVLASLDEPSQPGAAANDLLRMIQDVRDEIAANQQPTGTQQLNTDPLRSTLRDRLYEGDYRARDRIESKAQRSAGSGGASS